ncbi:MAG: thioredoxin domain-containing protein [bacterium]|nr:thioredoxin domain-containing protein [bacterium]
MSNKVITFLVVLFAVTGLIIYVAKTTTIVKTDAPQSQEAAVVPAPASGATPETNIETKPEATAANSESILNDDAPLSGDKEAVDAAKNEETAEKKAPASLTPESFPALPTAPVTGSSLPAAGSSSLLAPSASMDIDMDNALAERSIGDVDAPVTVIEYASMTCPHCARFHNEILPVVKQRLIDTGKLRLIFRDYPLDTHALKASMMARCLDRARYFQLVEVIFKQQTSWIKGTDPLVGLKQLGALAGMEPAYVDTCVANPQLQQFVLAGMQEGQQKYKIKATPTFIFNNGAEQMEGDKNPEDFDEIVEKLLKKKGK